MRSVLALISSNETQSLVQRGLNEGFSISFCMTSEEMHALLVRQGFDLILIDLAIDEDAALSLSENLRRDQRWAAVPLIFLSQIRDTRLLVRAFEAGGDDIIHVPFAPEELKVRVDAKFRRLQDLPVIHDLFWRADLRFSLGTQRVVFTDAGGDADLELTPNEFKILYLLARHEGKTMTRQSILTEVWGEHLHVVERTVDKHICSLRRKMGRRSHYVASVPGLGYCFSTTGMQQQANTYANVGALRVPKASL